VSGPLLHIDWENPHQPEPRAAIEGVGVASACGFDAVAANKKFGRNPSRGWPVQFSLELPHTSPGIYNSPSVDIYCSR
jgi:hypothetical protein